MLASLRGTYELERVHKNWEEVYVLDPLQDQLNERLWDRLLSVGRVAPGSHWLDAGCGTGDHSLRLKRRGYQCTSIDLSLVAVRRAQRFCRPHYDDMRCCCGALEALPFPDRAFEAVHCRGVLMHIPNWEQALGELCRVLKPGGTLILHEGNQASVEAQVVRIIRHVRRCRSTLISTPGGMEFWSSIEGHSFLVRMANIPALYQRLADHAVKPVTLMGTEFWDIHRFPAGPLRRAALRWNSWWLGHGKWQLSSGVGLVATKAVG